MAGFTLFFSMIYKNYIGQIRQVKRNSMLFFIPIFMFVFIYFFFSLDEVKTTFLETLEVGLIVEDEGIYAGMLTDALTDTEAFRNFANIHKGEPEDIQSSFEEGQLDAVITMPEGFVDSIMRFESNPIDVKISYKEPIKAIIIKNIMTSYEKYIASSEIGIMTLFDQMEELRFDWDTIVSYNEQISYDLIMTALSRNSMMNYHEVVNIPSVVSTIYYLMAIIIMFLMYIATYAAINLIREREDMCFLRLKISKISLLNYLLSKAIGTTLFISTIVLTWLVLFAAFTNGIIGDNLIFLSLFLMISILFNVSLAMFMTAYIEREEGVILFSNVFIFINAIIGGSIIPIPMMPETLQKMALISPNYWMIKGLLYYHSGYNMKQGLLIGLSLLLLSMCMLLLTSKQYKRSW